MLWIKKKSFASVVLYSFSISVSFVSHRKKQNLNAFLVAGVNDEILKGKIKLFLIKSFSLSCDLITLQIFKILGSYMNK